MHYKSVDHAESHLLSHTFGFDPALIREYAEELFARQESGPEDDEGWDSDLENQDVENCDVVRRKIRALIDNGEMKVGEFQKEINVTAPAYSRFMSQSGPYKGEGSSVYMAAWKLLKKRETRGIKTKKNAKSKTAAKARGVSKIPDVSDVEELDWEFEDKVPVYDTCDDIRRKINAHLKKPGVVQADFLRAASASFHTKPKKLTSAALSKFRSKRGALEGNTMDIFYGAYVYFEKLRIKEGKPMSKKREEMEEAHLPHWGNDFRGGINIKERTNSFICPKGAKRRVDSLGLVWWE